MTYEKFLKVLRSTKDENWRVWYRYIGIDNAKICPVCAAANKIIGKNKYTRDYHSANEQVLKLHPELTKNLALASDAKYSSGSQLRKFRNDILKALQLQDR